MDGIPANGRPENRKPKTKKTAHAVRRDSILLDYPRPPRFQCENPRSRAARPVEAPIHPCQSGFPIKVPTTIFPNHIIPFINQGGEDSRPLVVLPARASPVCGGPGRTGDS